MKVRKDIDQFVETLPKDVTLVAATKYVDGEELKVLLKHNINNFGENRVEAFLEKYNELKDENISWHFIGHLQRNKALKVINKIDYLHSLDSLKLAKIIDENRTTPLKCFIEVSINEEENKNGVKVNDIDNFIKEVLKFKNIELVGLMMMSIKSSDTKSLENQFKKLQDLQNYLQSKFDIALPYLSMGMSDDYLVALNYGATHVRLGRILFTN